MTRLVRDSALAAAAVTAVMIGWGGSALLVERQLTAAAAKADRLALEAPCLQAAVDATACVPVTVMVQTDAPGTTTVTRVELSIAE